MSFLHSIPGCANDLTNIKVGEVEVKIWYLKLGCFIMCDSVMRYVNFMNVKIQQFYFWGLPACQNFCRLSHLAIKIFVHYRPGSLACMVTHVTWVRASIATSSKHLITKFTFDVSKLSATQSIIVVTQNELKTMFSPTRRLPFPRLPQWLHLIRPKLVI